jgi:trehalose-phosphatase
MEPVSTALDHFFTQLGRARLGMLLLDYDGTLAPFHVDRLKAFPAEGVREILDEILANSHNQVVLVTGRPSEEVLSLLQPTRPICVWGCHGREYRDLEGNLSIHGVDEAAMKALDRGRERVGGLVDESRVDFKTGCLALHWRGIDPDDRVTIEEKVREAWEPLAAEHDLAIVNFDGGIELCIPGRTKGDAVNALLEGVDVEQTAVAFLGDDLTDEDGFRALKGRGLSVLVRNEPRDTVADVRITMPEGVLEFLRRWADCSRRRQNG